jgi:hypothetical protein
MKTTIIAIICTAALTFGQVTFYGATRITVPTTVTSVNLKTETMYRIFAMHETRGDISHEITINGDNWTVSTFPTTVTYQVAGESRTVEIARTGNVILVERTLYSWSRAALDAIQSGAAFRGDNQDKQTLGVFMPNNSSIRLRRLEGPQNIRIDTYRGQADDHTRTGNNVTLQNNNWVTLNNQGANRGGVPMVRTPMLGGTEVHRIELEVPGGGPATHLNYFHYGDDQAAFMGRWSSNNHQFVLLSNNVVQLMAAVSDRTDGRFASNGTASNISGLLGWYEEVVDALNRMSGLVANDPDPRHRLIPTRFFIVPADGGPGAAYYNQNDHCGMSGDRTHLHDYLDRHWVGIHEMAHGYEGHFNFRKEVRLVDIKNNIMGTLFQMTYLDFTNTSQQVTANGRAASWIFNYYSSPPANRGDLHQSAIIRRTGDVGEGTLGRFGDFAIAARRTPGTNTIGGDESLRERLYVLMALTSGAAANHTHTTVAGRALQMAAMEDAWGMANRFNREREAHFSLGNLMAKGFSLGTQTNLVPFLESYGFGISDLIRAQAFEDGSRIALPLRDFGVTTGGAVTSTNRQYWGDLTAVMPGDSRLTSGNGTATVIFAGADINGRTVEVRDGARVVSTHTVANNQISVTAPRGAYYLHLPHVEGMVSGYRPLLIRNGTNPNMTITYQELMASFVAGVTTFELAGIGDNLVARVLFDPVRMEVIVESAGEEPHYAWSSNAVYSSVTHLRNNNQVSNHRREHRARDFLPATTDRWPVQLNDVIRITHLEGASRAFAVNSMTGARDNAFHTFVSNGNNDFVVTPFGLMPAGINEDQRRQRFTTNFNAVLAEAAATIPPSKWSGMDDYTDIKVGFILGSQSLSDANRTAFDAGAGADFRGEASVRHNISVTHNIGGIVRIQGGATIASGSSTLVIEGNNVTLEFVPGNGNFIADVKINGASNSAAVAAGYYTFNSVEANASVEVEFGISPCEPNSLLSISRVRVNSWSTVGNDAFVPGSLFDGNPATYWHARYSEHGGGHQTAVESFVDIDLGSVRTVGQIEVDARIDRFVGAVRIFAHTDEGDIFPNGQTIPDNFPAGVDQDVINADFVMTGWTENTSAQTDGSGTATATLKLSSPVTARYIRLGITSVNAAGNTIFTQVSEIRVLCGEDGSTSIRTPQRSDSHSGIIFATNPTSDKAEIFVAEGKITRVVIYDALGNTVHDSPETIWDLTNQAGRRVAEGTYLVIAEVIDKDGRTQRYSARLGVKR